jgi:hypothetical protein
MLPGTVFGEQVRIMRVIVVLRLDLREQDPQAGFIYGPPLIQCLGQALLHLAAYLLHWLAPCPRYLSHASLMQQAPIGCDQLL